MKAEILKEKIDQHFRDQDSTSKEILNQIALFVYIQDGGDSDLYRMAKILPDEQLHQIINYFDGGEIKVPSKEDFYQCLLVALTFYLHKVKNLDWETIKDMIKIKGTDEDIIFNPVSLGKRLSKLEKQLMSRVSVRELINEIKIEDLKSIVSSLRVDKNKNKYKGKTKNGKQPRKNTKKKSR